jgi:hypothetical protein
VSHLTPFYCTVHVIFAGLPRHGLWRPPRPGVIVTSKKNLIPKGYSTFLYAEFKRARVSTVRYRAMSCRIVPCHTLTCHTVPSPVVLCHAMLVCYTVPCLTVPCRTVAELIRTKIFIDF